LKGVKSKEWIFYYRKGEVEDIMRYEKMSFGETYKIG
jgi:hypothetical protein